MSLFLLLSLSACVPQWGNVRPVVQTVAIPDTLLTETPVPEFKGMLNADLVLHIRELERAVQSCNDDKASAREFVEVLHAAGTE